MAFIVDAVANRFIDISKATDKPFSPMKLQKLVYFAHGWYLAFVDDPLIRESFELWEYGPVVSSLYQEFKDIGNGNINRHAMEFRQTPGGGNLGMELYAPTIEQSNCAEEEKAAAISIVDQVMSLYGKFSASQLSSMTHEKGTPWEILYSQWEGKIPTHLRIPNEMIRDHFKTKLQNSQHQKSQKT